jgi:hypothetical protein
MTPEEVQPFVGKPVRVTMADRRVIAGVLHSDTDRGHGHQHYSVVSRPLRAGEEPVAEVIHGSEQIVNIEDASNDPAARE